MGGPGRAGSVSRNTDLALAAGYVVVSPGCRGRDNQAADGTYYGKAPAAIVDLKAAVRYLRHNTGIMPGNTDWIVSTGVSAGGALSALLGASGNSHLYDAYLEEIGAADAADTVFASADFCPIMDLDHADMAYEWMYGAVPTTVRPGEPGALHAVEGRLRRVPGVAEAPGQERLRHPHGGQLRRVPSARRTCPVGEQVPERI